MIVMMMMIIIIIMFVTSDVTYLLETFLLSTHIFFKFLQTRYAEHAASRFQTHRHVIKQFTSSYTCNDTNYYTQFCDKSFLIFTLITECP